MRRLLSILPLVLVACSTTTVIVTPQASSPSALSIPSPPPPTASTPETFVVTYEVTGNTGPGFPENPAKISYDPGDGLLKTVKVRINGYWSRNVEIPDGGSIQLYVQASIFTSVDCDVDSFRLLNPIKGKTDVNGNGWTCHVASQTLSSR